jgi:hypothetical protein
MRPVQALLGLVVAAVAGAFGSCSHWCGPGDGSRPPSELNVVRVAPASEALFNPADSFYAVRGQDREVRIYFQDEVGGPGEEYLRLRVDAPTLLARPDGTPVATGDSVLIRVRVVDPTQMLFELEPSGLKFNPLVPARLVIHYDHAGGDFNDDGGVDAADSAIEGTLSIWRQETPADPFVRLGSVLSADLDEAEAELTGFSRYALAY